jgi:hypothetical protein
MDAERTSPRGLGFTTARPLIGAMLAGCDPSHIFDLAPAPAKM